jgi:ribosomal protection tetracycline resistance protein
VKLLNLGILAHVDAGKTTLTERLLYAAGVIDEVGRVDDGNTQTDTLALEQQRGITIRSAVVSFTIGDVTVNLIDTPGHSDFIAEVERVLGILDGAVLVVSAVEGVQAQTHVLMRVLQRLQIPTLVFVNKVDRSGAAPDAVFQEIAARLTPDLVAMGEVREATTRAAWFVPYGGLRPDETSGADAFTDRLADVLTRRDDVLLDDYVRDRVGVPYSRLRAELAAQTGRALVHPVFFGSAATGAGVEALMTGITALLPARDGDLESAASGTVFKVERGAAGEKVAYVRMFAGKLHVRDRVLLEGGREEAKVTAIKVFDRGSARPRGSVVAGQIAKLWGLNGVRVGDVIGDTDGATRQQQHFSPPSLETIVDACRPADRGAMHTALTQLAEQDPLIKVRQDDLRQEISVSLYGEVQKEVIQSMLADEYDVPVAFRETTTICVERPVAAGSALEVIATEPNPFLATVGLRVEPGPVDSGLEFRLGVELGSMPPAFFTAVQQTVTETLLQGIHGWEVIDCVVTMTHSGYWARQSHAHGTFDASMSSTAGDFRDLTPLVLMEALQRAGTRVHEPIHRFRLEVPSDTLGSTLSALAQVRGVPLDTEMRGSSYALSGDIPAARVHELRQILPELTHGAGVLVSSFDHYQPVQGSIPSRPRTDRNPLNREEYLLHVSRG